MFFFSGQPGQMLSKESASSATCQPNESPPVSAKGLDGNGVLSVPLGVAALIPEPALGAGPALADTAEGPGKKADAPKRRSNKARPAAKLAAESKTESPGDVGPVQHAAPVAPARSLRPRRLPPGALAEETLAATLSAAISPAHQFRVGLPPRGPSNLGQSPAPRHPAAKAPAPMPVDPLSTASGRPAGGAGPEDAAAGPGTAPEGGVSEVEMLQFLDWHFPETSGAVADDPMVTPASSGWDPQSLFSDSVDIHPDFDVDSLMAGDDGWLAPGNLHVSSLDFS